MKNYSSNELIKIGSSELQEAKISNTKFEAELILSHLLKLPKEKLLLKPYQVNELICSQFFSLIKKRKRHFPLQYIIGKWEFWSCSLLIEEGVFIPRPETETLIEMCIENFHSDKTTFIDLGTGTGNIAIALANEFTKAQILAIDISKKALSIAKKNIELNNLKNRINLIQSNFLPAINYKALKQPIIIVSNPPYISTEEIPTLPDEIRLYEPPESYIAGNNGLDCYFTIIQQLSKWNIKPIYIIFEITPILLPKIISFAKKKKFQCKKIKKDLLNLARALLLEKI